LEAAGAAGRNRTVKYQDYYATLGVARGASADEIKKAYRRLARKFHPDVSKEKDAEEKFKDVQVAYDTLSDAEKRAAYDQLGQHRPGEDIRPPPGWERHFRFEQGNFEDLDLSDLFERFGGGIFQGPSGRARRSGAGASGFSMAGQDYEVTAHLSLEEIRRGAEVSLDLTAPERTPDGRMQRVPRTVRVRVPRGATDGQRLRVPGKGAPGAGGGPTGDLYLNIALRPHPLYKVSGHDLYLELPLAPWEAALGAEVEVPTLDGRVKVAVRPGSRAGQKLRLSGKGLPTPRDAHGDLYCVLQIVTPSVLSEPERQLYEELRQISRFNPRGHLE
jgi:curved DNA-binding protein